MPSISPIIPRTFCAASKRSFSQGVPRFARRAPTSTPLPAFAPSGPSPLAAASKRFASSSSGWMSAPAVPGRSFEANGGWKRVGAAAAVVGGSILAANLVLNRETRGALLPYEQSHLNATFRYVGLGLAMAGGAAYGLHRSGFSARIMAANPWVVMAVGVGGGIASMYGVYNTSPSNHAQKMAFFTLFQGSQAIALAPLFFLNPAILARAGLYTLGVVGSLSYVGATARQDKFLYLGGPLLAGVTVVALSSLAPMVLPVTAMRTLAVTEALSLYGGLAVFSAMILYDTQKVLAHARMAAEGRMQADPVRESIALELDTINLFVRIVQLLMMQQNRRK